MKAANKGAQTSAESPEGRASTKGNSGDQSTHRTQGREGVSQAVERIRQAATRKPQEKLTALMHHITTHALRCAFYDLKKTASPGVDGMVWSEYEDGLDERLLALHGRVHSGAYRALPSRRVAIPKPDGGTRPLGIAALEERGRCSATGRHFGAHPDLDVRSHGGRTFGSRPSARRVGGPARPASRSRRGAIVVLQHAGRRAGWDGCR